MKQTQLIQESDEEVLRNQLLKPEELFMLDYLDGFNRQSNRVLDEDEFADFELEYD
jgi:hypothetical protein